MKPCGGGRAGRAGAGGAAARRAAGRAAARAPGRCRARDRAALLPRHYCRPARPLTRQRGLPALCPACGVMRAASAGVRLARLAQPWHTFHVASQTARTQPRSIRACCGQCLGLRRRLSCFACIAISVAPQSTPKCPKVHVGSGRQAALVAPTGRARSAATGLPTAVGMCCVLTLRGWIYAGQTGDNLDGVAAGCMAA